MPSRAPLSAKGASFSSAKPEGACAELAMRAFRPYPAAMRFLHRSLALVAPLALTALAVAQDSSKPPEPAFTPNTNPMIGYLIVAVLFGAIVAISLMPSKRTHTDI
jgi:heme A synthase